MMRFLFQGFYHIRVGETRDCGMSAHNHHMTATLASTLPRPVVCVDLDVSTLAGSDGHPLRFELFQHL